jgi:pimeloyl-ACP methyl ester carboxylesterase
MGPKRLVLFSGMGGDARLMRPIRIPGVEVVTPDHLEPEPGEDLGGYAERLADAAGVLPTDVVGGASFGGMVAAELSRRRPVAGVVLLGTCLHPERLPPPQRWLARGERFIPGRALGLRAWRPLLRSRFAPLTPEAEETLLAMARTCTPNQLRGFGRMIMSWRGCEGARGPSLCVHGDRDLIIPLRCAEPGLVLKDAGHAFTLTHAEATSAAIERFLKERVPA